MVGHCYLLKMADECVGHCYLLKIADECVGHCYLLKMQPWQRVSYDTVILSGIVSLYMEDIGSSACSKRNANDDLPGCVSAVFQPLTCHFINDSLQTWTTVGLYNLFT